VTSTRPSPLDKDKEPAYWEGKIRGWKEHTVKIAIPLPNTKDNFDPNANHKWAEIIEKQLNIMKVWTRSYPSMLARVRIAKVLIVSRALYLMMVNGIPPDLLKTMEKNIRNFIWLGKQGPIAWDRAIQNKQEGGIGAPSMTVLYEATKIIWLKRWMSNDEERPKWAWAVNEILVDARASNPTIDPNIITEWVEQKWKSKINVDKIPQSLRNLIKAAKRYNIKVSMVRALTELKLQMPTFSHPGRRTNRRENTNRSKCLRKNHAIILTGDLASFTNGPYPNEDKQECPGLYRVFKGGGPYTAPSG
jgi:hypothetical protein